MRQLYSFYTDAFGISIKSILEHKLRAFLTLIGIIIGVAAVVVVSASINGLKTYVTGQAEKILGSNHFAFRRIAFTGRMSDEEFERKNRLNKDVTWEEYEYIRDNCESCSFVGAQINGGADLSENGEEMPSVRILGVSETMYEIENKTMEFGRFFMRSEVVQTSKVCVLGNDVREKYFANTDPIGKTIKVRGVPLRIIGVEKARGTLFGNSQDRNIYIPVTLHYQMFDRTGGLQVDVGTATDEAFPIALEEATQLLRNKRRLVGSDEDNFSILNVDDISSQMDELTGAIAGVVIPVTLIILVVGGIVVMNIMLVSVTERTFEVGLRKAIGATRQQILLQFLIESAVLCVAGGIFGLILAVFVTSLITYFAEITMTITLGYVILSIAVSSIIGIIAGLYPAWKASKLDPIVALTQN